MSSSIRFTQADPRPDLCPLCTQEGSCHGHVNCLIWKDFWSSIVRQYKTLNLPGVVICYSIFLGHTFPPLFLTSGIGLQPCCISSLAVRGSRRPFLKLLLSLSFSSIFPCYPSSLDFRTVQQHCWSKQGSYSELYMFLHLLCAAHPPVTDSCT